MKTDFQVGDIIIMGNHPDSSRYKITALDDRYVTVLAVGVNYHFQRSEKNDALASAVLCPKFEFDRDLERIIHEQ